MIDILYWVFIIFWLLFVLVALWSLLHNTPIVVEDRIQRNINFVFAGLPLLSGLIDLASGNLGMGALLAGLGCLSILLVSRKVTIEGTDLFTERDRERGSYYYHPIYGKVRDLRTEKGKAFEREAQSPLSKDDEAAARKLCELVREVQEWEGDEYKEFREAMYEEMKEIGRQLYANGGHDRMLKVGYRVKALDGLAGSYVESYWNGIGGWKS